MRDHHLGEKASKKQEAVTLLRNACFRPHDSKGASVELKDEASGCSTARGLHRAMAAMRPLPVVLPILLQPQRANVAARDF